MTQPVRHTFVTDEELRERGTSELAIDRLDRKVETQKMANGSRDRAAVGAALSLNHD